MSVKYLLPCYCGSHVTIEPRQAGETVVCTACGASIQAPTMLAMSRLEPAPEMPLAPRAEANWSWPHRALFFGLVLIAAAAVLAALLFWNHPTSRFDVFTPEQIRETARQLPPARTWDTWEIMKQGLDQRIDQPYAEALTRFHIWLAATAVLLLIGVGLAVGGLAAGGRLTQPGNSRE